MDLGAPRHYVATAMEFLLILSAVLSAVTGAFTGTRAPDVRPHQEASARIVAAVEPVATVARSAIQAPALIPAAARIVADARPAPLPAASIPLYADRLIE